MSQKSDFSHGGKREAIFKSGGDYQEGAGAGAGACKTETSPGGKRVVMFRSGGDQDDGGASAGASSQAGSKECIALVEKGRMCLTCKKNPATYGPAECDDCTNVYCKRCAMKFATGGRCKKCGKLFASMKRSD